MKANTQAMANPGTCYEIKTAKDNTLPLTDPGGAEATLVSYKLIGLMACNNPNGNMRLGTEVNRLRAGTGKLII